MLEVATLLILQDPASHTFHFNLTLEYFQNFIIYSTSQKDLYIFIFRYILINSDQQTSPYKPN